MLRNYLKIAVRNLLKHKAFSFINIIGIAIGLACFLLIALYVRDELGYDRFHQKSDRIYRVTRTFLSSEGTPSLRLAQAAPPFGPLIKQDFPEAEQVVRTLETNSLLRYGEQSYNEENLFVAEENLFRVFDFKLVNGNPAKALVNPFSILFSRPMAEKYFGKENPVGKTVRLDSQFELTVTGVFEPLPAQSHFHPRFLLSFSTLSDPRVYGAEGLRTNWSDNSFNTYVLMANGADPQRMERAFPAFQNRHVPADDGKKSSTWSVLTMQPLTDIHLHSHTDSEIEPTSDIRYVYLFSAIGLFILLIACINYMNLATARSAGRAKEVGMRKVAGALRSQLIAQFLSESVLLVVLALGLAVGLVLLGLPLLNEFTQKTLTIRQLLDPVFLGVLVAITGLTGLVAGSYPAFFLTSFRPIGVLKGRVTAAGGGRLRQVLVVAQFAIAVALIISTAVVFNQMNYIQHYRLGYEKDRVLILPDVGDSTTHYETVRQELVQTGLVREMGRSSRIPSGRLLDSYGAYAPKGDSLVPVTINLRGLRVDYNFIPSYQIGMAAGRNFSRSFGTDTSMIVLNETAARLLGWTPQQAIGKPFRYGPSNGQIIGVTKDYHFESLHQRVGAIALTLNPTRLNYLSVSLKGGDISAAVQRVEGIWKKYFPGRPFDYQFLDARFDRLYAREQTQQRLFGVFAGVAILISCLGLFGLSMFMAEQRTKEIGIRKVLGATVPGLVALLSRDLLKLVLIALLLASPVAWWAMNQWLDGFAYRTSIGVGVFLLTGLVAISIALLTVSFQAIKAALMNPVKSLRAE